MHTRNWIKAQIAGQDCINLALYVWAELGQIEESLSAVSASLYRARADWEKLPMNVCPAGFELIGSFAIPRF